MIISRVATLLSLGLFTQVFITTDSNGPNPSAGLEVKFTDKGLLFPRVGNVAAISNTVAGLQVYDQSVSCMRYYNGTAWSECMGKPFICGDPFMDSRDGKVYNSVQIGNQCWMAENINIGTMINGSDKQTDDEVFEKYCYKNKTSNCDTYGGLYQWNEMMEYNTTLGVQGICPAGWHLPTDAEWCILEQEVDSTITCRSTGWRGVHGGTKLKKDGDSGFEALLAGDRYTRGPFYNLDSRATFWSSSEKTGTYALGMYPEREPRYCVPGLRR